MTATTTIKDEMLAYFTRLNKNEQQSVLGLIKTFVDSREEMRPQTLQEYNDELEDAVTRIEAGHYITHDEVKKRILNKP